MSTPNIHPHELRELVREQTYPNSNVEAETIAEVDRIVFDRVRTYESQIVENAEKFLQEKALDLQAADEIAVALEEEIRLELARGGQPTAELAKRYKVLRRNAEFAIAELERADSEAEWYAARALDPYSSWVLLMKRWPLLRMDIV